jgi:hypothetical protein
MLVVVILLSKCHLITSAAGAWQELKPVNAKYMLTALIACGLIRPVLAFDATANHDAITFFAAINYNLSRLAPDLNVYCIIDVVALAYPCLP